MKRYTTGTLTLIAIAAVLSATIWLGRSNHNKKAPPVSKFMPAPVVETGHPVRRSFSRCLKWFGRVESKTTVKIVSLAAGKIKAVKVADGAHVRKGEVLFTLGGPQVAHTIDTLNRRIAALEKQESLAQNAVQLKREAVAARITKKEELLSAQQHLVQLESDLLAVKEELTSFEDALLVRSPMGGIFANRQVSPGQDVKEGTHLADVISTDLRIRAFLFPLAEVRLVGKTAVVQTSPDAKLNGTVVKVLPKRTAEGATVIWIEGREIPSAMKPGERVSGWVVLEVSKSCLAIPRDAIVRDEEGHPFVFVKTQRGYQKKVVKIGLTNDGWYEVVSGVSDKDEVVVRGAYELFYWDFTKRYKVTD